MKTLIIVSYVVAAVAAITVFAICDRRRSGIRPEVEPIFLEWVLKFNPSIRLHRFTILLIVVYLAWVVYSISTQPDRNNGHFSLMLIVFLASFYPIWKFAIGENGVLLGLRSVTWDRLIQWKEFDGEEGTRVELQWRQEGKSTVRKRVIMIPGKLSREFLGVLRDKAGDKEEQAEKAVRS